MILYSIIPAERNVESHVYLAILNYGFPLLQIVGLKSQPSLYDCITQYEVDLGLCDEIGLAGSYNASESKGIVGNALTLKELIDVVDMLTSNDCLVFGTPLVCIDFLLFFLDE